MRLIEHHSNTMNSLTTPQVIIRIIAIITSVEFLIMLLLGAIPLELSISAEATLDIALLALLSTPLITIGVIRPFVTARDDALEQINQLAHTDPLTQLPNRRLVSLYLEKFIAEMARHQMRGAVLLLDLDGFKRVNDLHGHEAGDDVLIETAKRLQANIRSEDVAGRLGGDEFIILLHHLDADEAITRDFTARIAEKLITLAKAPMAVNDTSLTIGTSIGIRLLDFEEGDTKTVMREADSALYRAKQTGKGCAVFFET